ncbi:MarR family winged helix-turn-helix transcriptional regulator [Aquimarina sp. W85]|uniref:MarR family winged helix-turn-helix transcriptional regulator n=1 Tax=Aquimarina rhodophyticola TaxID=3342246 RepID=UPI00366D73FA
MKIEELIQTKTKLPWHKKVLINLIYTERILKEHINAELKPFDISAQQFNVLRILKGQKGVPANLLTIQERMVSKMSNTTRLVDKLIAKKLVERRVCPSNRRKIEITITQDGLCFLNKIDPIIEELEKKITASFTQEELEQFNNLLEKLRS